MYVCTHESTGMFVLKHIREKGEYGKEQSDFCVVQAGLKFECAADKRKWNLAGMPLRHVGLERQMSWKRWGPRKRAQALTLRGE